MSRLNELLKELCPDGVEYKELETVCSFMSGFAFKASTFTDSGEPICKTTNIQNNEVSFEGMDCFNLSDYSENLDKYIIRPNDIVIGMSGTIKVGINRTSECCYLNQRVGKFEPDENLLNNKFLYYILCNSVASLVDGITGGSVKNLSNKDILKLLIPVPPIEIQEEIVNILDNFSELTVRLNDELSARRKQYAELSYQLLIKKNTAHIYQIKELCDVTKGKTPIQKSEPGEYPLVVTTSERKSCNTCQYDASAVCIPLVSSRGHGVASLNHVYYQEGKFALGNILCAVVPKDKNVLSAKYLYFYFECTKDYTLVPLMKGGANVSMHIPDIEKVKIPVPDIETQQTIVSKLEVLDEYCNVVLPAEIEARQKQYEYYRDKLLTFKEASE